MRCFAPLLLLPLMLLGCPDYQSVEVGEGEGDRGEGEGEGEEGEGEGEEGEGEEGEGEAPEANPCATNLVFTQHGVVVEFEAKDVAGLDVENYFLVNDNAIFSSQPIGNAAVLVCEGEGEGEGEVAGKITLDHVDASSGGAVAFGTVKPNGIAEAIPVSCVFGQRARHAGLARDIAIHTDGELVTADGVGVQWRGAGIAVAEGRGFLRDQATNGLLFVTDSTLYDVGLQGSGAVSAVSLPSQRVLPEGMGRIGVNGSNVVRVNPRGVSANKVWVQANGRAGTTQAGSVFVKPAATCDPSATARYALDREQAIVDVIRNDGSTLAVTRSQLLRWPADLTTTPARVDLPNELSAAVRLFGVNQTILVGDGAHTFALNPDMTFGDDLFSVVAVMGDILVARNGTSQTITRQAGPQFLTGLDVKGASIVAGEAVLVATEGSLPPAPKLIRCSNGLTNPNCLARIELTPTSNVDGVYGVDGFHVTEGGAAVVALTRNTDQVGFVVVVAAVTNPMPIVYPLITGAFRDGASIQSLGDRVFVTGHFGAMAIDPALGPVSINDDALTPRHVLTFSDAGCADVLSTFGVVGELCNLPSLVVTTTTTEPTGRLLVGPLSGDRNEVSLFEVRGGKTRLWTAR